MGEVEKPHTPSNVELDDIFGKEEDAPYSSHGTTEIDNAGHTDGR